LRERAGTPLAPPSSPQRGIHTHSIDLRIDTSTPMGQFVLHFSSEFAELEHQYASLRTKEVVASMPQKRHPRFYDAIGWRHVPGSRGDWHLVPDPEEREVVERIHQMEASGMSQEDISNAL